MTNFWKSFLENVFVRKFGARWFFCFLGFVLAQGAPIGFVIHNQVFQPETSITTATLTYIWLGTSIFFSLFGFVVGNLIEEVQKQTQKNEISIQTLKKYEQIRNQMNMRFARQWQSPLATVLEVFEELQSSTSEQKKSLYDIAQKEINDFYKNLQNHFNIMNYFQGYDEEGEKLSIQTVNSIFSDLKIGTPKTIEKLSIRLSKKTFLQVFQIFLMEIKSISRNPLQIQWTFQAPHQSISDSSYIYLILADLQIDAITESSSWQLLRSMIEIEGGQVWIQNKDFKQCQIVFSFPISQHRVEAA